MSSPTDQSDALGDYPELSKHVLKNVLHTRTIGAGTYGIVEEVVIPSSGTICAAKKIHAFNIQDRGLMVREFAKECQLMSSLLHPNVVQFFGIYYFPSDPLPSLVMERMLTSLHDLLDPKKRGNTEKSLFSLDLKFSILHDVASGLAYLHDQSPPIVHRNLSAKNVLLNSGMVAKVADLAEARRVSNTNIATLMTKCHGALYYLPPEARTERPEYDGTIDTFSFGVIAIFTISENFPCDVLEPNYTDEASGLLVPRTEVERRIKYLKNVEVKLGGRHPHLLELIRVCLHNHPPRRPNMKTVLDQLKKAGGGARPDEENVLIKALRRQVEELQSNIEAKDGQLSKAQQQLQDKECELTKEIAELRKEELEWKENNAKLTKEIEDLKKNELQN
jgi:serine/threonine protein kinase